MYHFRFCTEVDNAIALNHRIQCKCSTAFSLAPLAVTAVDKEWLGFHAIANGLAIASAFDGEFSCGGHDGGASSDT